MFMRLLAVCLVLVGAMFCTVFSGNAQTCNGFDGVIGKARRLHDLGAAGDKDAVISCVEMLEMLCERDPKNHLARVYLGSAYTLRSRDLPPGPGKLDALVKGGKLMDQAVADAPNDPRVRLVRAINNLELPAIFRRRPVAYEDLEWLLETARKNSPKTSVQLRADELQAVYFFGGLALQKQKRKDEAAAAWRDGIRLNSKSPLAVRMREALGEEG